jgi:hypothetical protein
MVVPPSFEGTSQEKRRPPALGKACPGPPPRPRRAEIQQFWTLRHDGLVWRLHQVEPATDERTDLAKKPPLPPLMEWKRPA